MTNSQKIRRLYNLPDEDNFGFSETEMTALEQRLDITLPAALKNYYLSLGKNESINYSHNRLLKPAKEIGSSKDRYLIFYEENQMVVSWGIKEADLNQPNPPVWGNSGTEEDPDWYLEANTTDDFFLLMSVYNGTLGGLKYNANFLGDVDPKIVESIIASRTLVAEISYEKQKVYTDQFDEVISLSFDDEDRCNAIFVGTSDVQRFDIILYKVAVDWSYTSYMDDEDYEEDY